ncbi:MAG TPA: cytochrome c peroxidase, partial [Chitinophagaceae bacterium]|nr:cytochrome c peroxidase [Chitinophagaceae bacterium]
MLLHRRKFELLTLIVAGIYALYSCHRSAVVAPPITDDHITAVHLPLIPFNYANPPLPHFFLLQPVAEQDNTPSSNPVTDWGATLGRVLFYDKVLSLNNTIACGSCHKQSLSFADDRAFSVGFDGRLTKRNSMSLINVKFYRNSKFLWDERGTSLETQTLLPIIDHIEMGLPGLDELVNRLKTKPYYPILFKKAFGSETITSSKVGDALAQFIRSIISYQSKFDEGRTIINSVRSPYPNFTAQENEGKQLFFNPLLGCNGCHKTEAFTAPSPKNNGLEIPSIDPGVGAITNDLSQIGNFKAPSLKNIELTAPYMHDGRFKTLEEVIEHYNSGVMPHPNLSSQLRNPDNTPVRLHLSSDEKNALIAFLKTLTDRSIVGDVRFSDPF